MYVGLDVKNSLILSDSNETWIFCIDFRNVFKYKISTEIRPVEIEIFYVDGRTNGRDEANGHFYQLCECA